MEKPMRIKDCDSWLTDIEKYEGPGIYSLVDENGKRYIGQAKNVYKRLRTHRNAINNVHYKGNSGSIVEGQKICDAVLAGHKFRVEILKKIPWYEATLNELTRQEKYYLDLYGGRDNTYNMAPMDNPLCETEKFAYTVELPIKLEKGLVDYLKDQGDANEYLKKLIREDMKREE